MQRFLSTRTIRKYIPLMERENVSEVARSSRGFLTAYLASGGNLKKLGPYWIQRREGFIARHMAQMISQDEPFFKSPGHPTRRHLALIAWAYSPSPSGLKRPITYRTKR